MNVQQQSALEELVDRVLTAPEITVIDEHLPARNDVAIAAILSVNRTRLQSKYIGIGTIIAEMEAAGLDGGEFLDELEAIGATNRKVYWIMFNIQQGRLDIGEAATQEQVTLMKLVFPTYAAGIDRLLALGSVPDPIHFNTVSDKLNIAEGRMTL